MNIKQKIALGLCAFYLVSVIGLALSMHFCAGKLSSVAFVETALCKVCKKAEKVSHNCCKTTAVDVKIKDSHQAGFKVKLPDNFSLQLFLGPRVADLFAAAIPSFLTKVENKAPPLSSIISLHIYHCVFRN